MTLTNLETTAIVIIVIIVYYVIMMVISIILHKTGHDTAARWVKTLSILNYPFKKLDEYSVHVKDEEKYRNQAVKYAATKALDVVSSSDIGKKLIKERMQVPSEPPAQQVETIHETIVEPLPQQPAAASDVDVF